MKQNAKSAILFIFQPTVIVFCVAAFDFIFFWRESLRMGGACVACPWYYPWSYTNEPSVILIASIFLLIKRWWSYLTSFVLSGYLIAYFIRLFVSIDMTLREEFKLLLNSENIFSEWETQYFLALIVFSLGAFYIVKSYYKKDSKLI